METPKLLRLNPMKAAYVYSMSANPEEEALNKISAYAKANGLKNETGRLFGRNIYPTDKPEPHGYEYYLAVNGTVKEEGEVAAREVPSGLYAVSEVKNICNLTEGWQKLFTWVEVNGYQLVGVGKGEHGWVNSTFEELVDWWQEKPPADWVFLLMVQLKE